VGGGAQWVMKRGTCALCTMKTYEDTKTTFYKFSVASPQSYSQNCKVLYTHFSLCESIFFSVRANWKKRNISYYFAIGWHCRVLCLWVCMLHLWDWELIAVYTYFFFYSKKRGGIVIRKSNEGQICFWNNIKSMFKVLKWGFVSPKGRESTM
jgi:hypothetical protein